MNRQSAIVPKIITKGAQSLRSLRDFDSYMSLTSDPFLWERPRIGTLPSDSLRLVATYCLGARLLRYKARAMRVWDYHKALA